MPALYIMMGGLLIWAFLVIRHALRYRRATAASGRH